MTTPTQDQNPETTPLPNSERIQPAQSGIGHVRLGTLPMPNQSWPLSQIGTAVGVAILPIFVEFVFNGSKTPASDTIVSLATVCYSLFALSATALVQVVSNRSSHHWIIPVIAGLLGSAILALNVSVPESDGKFTELLLAIQVLIVTFSVLVAWSPRPLSISNHRNHGGRE